MAERLDAFMARANAAYYATHDPFADFTTAPEIGQMFGELLGAWAAVTWQGMGAPDPVLLVEAGPGRGTLMGDALRAVARVAPGFRAACRVHFIETSARLRACQRAAVPDAAWHDALERVPAGPAIVVANEFLDALPIRQFERRRGAWFERFVGNARFTLRPAALQGDAPEGAVLELNEAGLAWTGALAARLAVQGGAALILDYGRDAPGFGDSLQALRHGRRADPLQHPGEADLTAHVDFPALAAAARKAGAVAHGPVGQGAFLHALGLRVRTERLAAAHPGRAAALRDAADRLASPARMGQLFKALAITPSGAPPPPGFDSAGSPP
jgi:SAM-dependent MidA family methyltransferase